MFDQSGKAGKEALQKIGPQATEISFFCHSSVRGMKLVEINQRWGGR